jgi:hypothetical protein
MAPLAMAVILFSGTVSLLNHLCSTSPIYTPPTPRSTTCSCFLGENTDGIQIFTWLKILGFLTGLERNEDKTVKHFVMDIDTVMFLGQPARAAAPKAEESPRKIGIFFCYSIHKFELTM